MSVCLSDCLSLIYSYTLLFVFVPLITTSTSQQCDHVPSPTSPGSEEDGEESHGDGDGKKTTAVFRDLHGDGDYDYGDRQVASKERERVVVEEDDDDDNDEKEEGGEEKDPTGVLAHASAELSASAVALELRAREDKAAMDRLVVAMAGEGVVVWRHQSGFHKEMVRGVFVFNMFTGYFLGHDV